jgi:hypothetical protein
MDEIDTIYGIKAIELYHEDLTKSKFEVDLLDNWNWPTNKSRTLWIAGLLWGEAERYFFYFFHRSRNIRVIRQLILLFTY